MWFSQKNKKMCTLVTLIFLFAISIIGANESAINKAVSFDAEDVSISTVLSTLAKLSECNIVLAVAQDGSSENDKKDEPRVTIHIEDVPIEQAIGLVVKTVGLSYRLIGEKTFLVGEKQKIEEEVGERSYIIQLKYIDAKKIEDTFSLMKGKIKAMEGQNALLINANPETYLELSKRIEELDIPQKQIEIRARLVEVSVTDAKKVGIDWSKLSSLTTIIAENPESADGVGLPYQFQDETGALTYGEYQEFNKMPTDQVFQKIDGFDNIGHFSRQLTAFDITIDWLLENNAAQVLTDTKITAMNGEEASIHIGEIVPYVAKSLENEYQVNRESVGIKLDILPKVNIDGQITVKLSPEVSNVVELIQGYLPRVKTRNLNTTVTVQDGNKIIIGGLLSTNIIEKNNKVPFFGDLPWVGKFFQHKSESVETTDLIIEIIPRVITNDDFDINYEIDERLERKLIK